MAELRTVRESALADDIDAITDAGEHLRVISELVQRHVAPERRAVYEAKMAEVASRATDPHLKLAVIGEFSSGKSTFINAMLRTRLLKASCVATTASVTRIRKGPTLTIAASFTDGRTITATAEDYEELRRAAVALQPAAAADPSLKDLLDRLTSDPVVADHVREIDITMPSEQLDDNIVILDTPGINAGVEEAKNHAQVTQRVVNEIADCALVLISAANPLTSTLLQFLQSHARSFLHRCIFVITAVDRHDEEERAETREFVRHKLREILGLDAPFIVESAAIAMLPVAEVSESMREARARGQSEFLVLEASVRAALLRERTLIIAERLIRILQELVAEMERELAASAAALDDEERVLRENRVAAIEQVLDALHARSAADVEKRAKALRLETLNHRNGLSTTTKDWVNDFIDKSGAGLRNYAQSMHSQIAAGVQHYGEQYSRIINREVAELRARCEMISAEFARQFESAYRELPSLGVPISVAPIAIAPVPDPSVFRSVLAHAEQQGKSDRKRRSIGGGIGGVFSGIAFGWLGTIPGAVIGASLASSGSADAIEGCFLGFFGFIFGAIAGGVAGILLATYLGAKSGSVLADLGGANDEERRRNLRAHLASDIDAFFDEMHGTFDRHIDAAVRGVTESFAAAVQRHKTTYGAAVERLRGEHDQKQRAVSQKIFSVRADAAELNQRAARLQTLRNRLALKRVRA